MSNAVKTDDVIFNFFKQICDEKDDKKCVELGNSWINAMETNLTKMEASILVKLVSIALIQLLPSSTHFLSSFSSQICLKKLKITSSVLTALLIEGSIC